MSFNDNENNGNVDCNEYTEVSDAQEGLVRVYERVLNVAAETDGCYFENNGVVSCRLLVDSSLVGFVIGKGGKGVYKIRKDTGCKVIVCGREKLPSCAMANDDMIEVCVFSICGMLVNVFYFFCFCYVFCFFNAYKVFDEMWQ